MSVGAYSSIFKLLFLRGEKFSCVILEGAFPVSSLTIYLIIFCVKFCVDIHVGCRFDVLFEFSYFALLTRCFAFYLLIVRDLYFARIPDPRVFDDAWGYFVLKHCFSFL